LEAIPLIHTLDVTLPDHERYFGGLSSEKSNAQSRMNVVMLLMKSGPLEFCFDMVSNGKMEQ